MRKYQNSVSFTISALPTPSISGNTVVCSGAATNTLTALAASSYLWGDGSTNQTINGIGGSYAVTVTDANGCQSATGISVAVNNPVSVTINPDPASFVPEEVLFLNAGTGFDMYALIVRLRFYQHCSTYLHGYQLACPRPFVV